MVFGIVLRFAPPILMLWGAWKFTRPEPHRRSVRFRIEGYLLLLAATAYAAINSVVPLVLGLSGLYRYGGAEWLVFVQIGAWLAGAGGACLFQTRLHKLAGRLDSKFVLWLALVCRCGLLVAFMAQICIAVLVGRYWLYLLNAWQPTPCFGEPWLDNRHGLFRFVLKFTSAPVHEFNIAYQVVSVAAVMLGVVTLVKLWGVMRRPSRGFLK